MSSDSNHQQVFGASFQRARSDPAFIDRFYDRFIASSPEVAALFSGRDVRSIARKLTTTLELLADSARNEPGFDLYLDLLARTHSRFDISPAMFDAWRTALIETLRDCDPLFDASVETAWNDVIHQVLHTLKHPNPARNA